MEIAGILGVLFSFYLLWRYWAILPDRIPTHYNFSGQPNSWGGKGTLIILPLVALFNFIVMAVLERFPHIYNYPVAITETNTNRQYTLARSLLGWLKFEIVWFFACLEWRTIQVALGEQNGLGPTAVFIFIAATILTVAVYFRQAYKAR